MIIIVIVIVIPRMLFTQRAHITAVKFNISLLARKPDYRRKSLSFVDIYSTPASYNDCRDERSCRWPLCWPQIVKTVKRTSLCVVVTATHNIIVLLLFSLYRVTCSLHSSQYSLQWSFIRNCDSSLPWRVSSFSFLAPLPFLTG